MADQIIPITRPSGSPPTPASQPVVVASANKFPSEVINLPSKGWFYPVESPLSSGMLELKLMTAKEEDILTSRNLIQKNIVLDKLLESVIIDKRIVADDMFLCDRDAAFFATRRFAYGEEYDAQITCDRCTKETPVNINLSTMDNRPFDFEKYVKGENRFEFKLPVSSITLTYKMLTKRDNNAIDAEITGYEKISKEFSKVTTTRLNHIITSVDGNTDRSRIRRFVNEELKAKDSLEFRNHLRNSMPDLNTEFEFECSHCGAKRKEQTPMGISFFWPNGRV